MEFFILYFLHIFIKSYLLYVNFWIKKKFIVILNSLSDRYLTHSNNKSYFILFLMPQIFKILNSKDYLKIIYLSQIGGNNKFIIYNIVIFFSIFIFIFYFKIIVFL